VHGTLRLSYSFHKKTITPQKLPTEKYWQRNIPYNPSSSFPSLNNFGTYVARYFIA